MIPLTTTIKNDLSSNVLNLQYLVEIGSGDETIYISSNKQMFNYDQSTSIYYEDLDLRVSNISERIDLKSKKIQLSSVSITLTNSISSGKRLSDRLLNPLGSKINIYIKTQSCNLLTECVPIAKLKITRYDHDDKSVNINADDISLETFYLDLPRDEHELKIDHNTFENYDGERIPILYGHLKTAPALVYVPDVEHETYYQNNSIKLICDSSFFDDNINIRGIKHFNNIDGVSYTNLWDNDCVQIKLGKSIHSIPCLPYANTHADIKELFAYPQYQTSIDHVVLISQYDDSDVGATLISSNGIWCSSVQKPITEKISTINNMIASVDAEVFESAFLGNFNYHQDGIDRTVVLNHLKNIPNDWWGADNIQNAYEYSIGLKKYEFNAIGEHDIFEKYNEETGDPEQLRTDISIIGRLSYEYNRTFGSELPDTMAIGLIYSQPFWKNYATSREDNYVSMGFPQFTVDYEPPLGDTFFGPPFHLMMGVGGWVLEGGADITMFDGSFRVGSMTSETTKKTLSYFKSVPLGMFTPQYHVSAASDFETQIPTPLESTQATFYYLHGIAPLDTVSNNFIMGEDDEQRYALDLTINDDSIGLRKMWANKDIFQNDFFVNARGRISDEIIIPNAELTGVGDNDLDLTNAIQVNGSINFLSTESLSSVDEGATDDHFHLFERLLREEEYRVVNGKTHQLMLKTSNHKQDHPHGGNDRIVYLYDIDIENIIPKPNGFDNYPPLIVDNPALQQGITAYFGSSAIQIDSSLATGTQEDYWNDMVGADKVECVYGYINYNSDNPNMIDSVDISEVEGWDEANGMILNAPEFWQFLGNTYITWDKIEDTRKLVEQPTEIIKHIVEKEMSGTDIDTDKYLKSFISDQDNRFAFSINEVENSKDIIERICEQSRLMFRYRPRDGKAILDTMKDTYSDEDVDYTIITNNMLKYRYSKTKIEDLCVGGCRVIYKHDYTKRKPITTTDDAFFSEDESTNQSILDSYMDYYGIEDADNYQLEVKAPYIQDIGTAERLRNFMFYQYKNQHLIMKFSMSTRDAIKLEVGDIINFDDNPKGIKPYGRDITNNYTILNDQIVYPYFIITSINKDLKSSNIECYQLHELRSLEDDGDEPISIDDRKPEYFAPIG